MKKKGFIIIGLLIVTGCSGQYKKQQESYLAETDLFVFHSHFWLNMHHFWHHEALVQKLSNSSVIDSTIWNKLSVKERELTESVIEYYKEEIIDDHFFFDTYSIDFKEWIQKQDEIKLNNIPDIYEKHTNNLMSSAEVYRKYFWPSHNKINKEILDRNLSMIDKTEEVISKQLSNLSKVQWQQEKIRVDISYYANTFRWNLKNVPYTTINPTHVVMNSFGQLDVVEGNWLELLFHEASHHLIGPNTGHVSNIIKEVSNKLEVEVPRDLWHAYLFYFAGKVTQDVLKDYKMEGYETYMKRNKVFSSYHPLFDEHLKYYIKGDKTLLQVTNTIITSLIKVNNGTN